MRTALVVALLAAAACTDTPNTQRLPIGSHCGGDTDCGTQPFLCAVAGYPGGYCERGCTTDGDCPADAACLANLCRRKCTLASQCRVDEGYACRDEGATSAVCDVRAGGAPFDAGPPSG